MNKIAKSRQEPLFTSMDSIGERVPSSSRSVYLKSSWIALFMEASTLSVPLGRIGANCLAHSSTTPRGSG
jgi:hypothetical protein